MPEVRELRCATLGAGSTLQLQVSLSLTQTLFHSLTLSVFGKEFSRTRWSALMRKKRAAVSFWFLGYFAAGIEVLAFVNANKTFVNLVQHDKPTCFFSVFCYNLSWPRSHSMVSHKQVFHHGSFWMWTWQRKSLTFGLGVWIHSHFNFKLLDAFFEIYMSPRHRLVYVASLTQWLWYCSHSGSCTEKCLFPVAVVMEVHFDCGNSSKMHFI